MAFIFWRRGSVSDKTAGTSWTLNSQVPTSETIDSTKLSVLLIGFDNVITTDGDGSTITSVTDSAGNTYTKAIEFQNGQGSAAAGAAVSIWYCQIVNTLTDTSTATINFGSNSVTAKSALFLFFDYDETKTIAIDGTATLADDGADPGSLTATGAQSVEHLWVRAIASESNSSTVLTVTSGWDNQGNNFSPTSGGSSVTNMCVRTETKIATGTGSGASDPTLFSADHASAIVGLIETSGGGGGGYNAVDAMGMAGFFGA